jgi:hypothetical protein
MEAGLLGTVLYINISPLTELELKEDAMVLTS